MTDETASLGHSLTHGRIQPVRLLVIDGPDRGRATVVDTGTAMVGSHEDCALRLTDPAVSRRHLAIELLGSRVRVKDLSSKNGSRYLGSRFEAIELALGSTVELGTTRLAIIPALQFTGPVSDVSELAGLLGRSLPMRKLFAQILQVAPTDASVLVTGETGSGKEGVARALHSLSTRSAGPFRVFDCAVVARDLVQSALFGHVKGAFTGAVKDTTGALEDAHGGVLFLDEIAELPMELQPSLLRALETKSFQRVGDTKLRTSDFRIVAATHHDLAAKSQAGRFRLDLYYRVAALTLEVPPLRARPEDIALLAHRFAAEANAKTLLSPSTLAALSAWRWPGNVRELKNAVERVVALGPEAALPGVLTQDAPLDFHETRTQAIRAFERSYLEALLERHQGNASAAAREAGIARSYLYKMLDEHGLKRG